MRCVTAIAETAQATPAKISLDSARRRYRYRRYRPAFPRSGPTMSRLHCTDCKPKLLTRRSSRVVTSLCLRQTEDKTFNRTREACISPRKSGTCRLLYSLEGPRVAQHSRRYNAELGLTNCRSNGSAVQQLVHNDIDPGWYSIPTETAREARGYTYNLKKCFA